MNQNLVYNKNGIFNQRRKNELSTNGVGTVWKNKYRYLLHTTIIPNGFKTSSCKNKIARVLEGKMEIYFNWVKVSLSKTQNPESMKEKILPFFPHKNIVFLKDTI